MKVTKETSPITWEFMPEPEFFPCMICMENKAKIKLVLISGRIPFQHLMACEPCSNFSASEVYDKIRTKKGGGIAKVME